MGRASTTPTTAVACDVAAAPRQQQLQEMLPPVVWGREAAAAPNDVETAVDAVTGDAPPNRNC